MRTLQEHVNLASFLFVVLILNVEVLHGSQSGRHTYVVRYKHGDSLIPVTVVLDYKRQTEYVINMNSRTPAKSVTLYDFKEKVIAYKDLKNGECFIGRLTHETIQEEDAVLKRLKSPVESQPLILSLEPHRPSLTPTEVRNMAGHKAAVFCRRMNTWTLMPEKENRRERRDTLNYLDRPSSRLDEHPKSKRASPQRNAVFKPQHDNSHRNGSHRDFSSFQNNGSFSVTDRVTDHLEAVTSPQTTVLDTSNQQQRLNNVYPFLLPRQKTVVEKQEDRRAPSGSLRNYNATRKTADGSTQRFVFAHEKSNGQTPSQFSQSRPSGADDGISSLPSSTKHTFIPLKTNRPIIIPSVNFPGTFPEGKYPGNNVVNQVHSPGIFPGGYPPNGNSFNTLHNRGETVNNYPALHQLPPEAFVLPLTRSSTATTPPFVFSNRLGYEIVHSESPSAFNNSDPPTGGSSNKSADIFKSVLTSRSNTSALDLHPLSINTLDNHEVIPAIIPGVIPLHSHNLTRNKENKSPVFLEKDLDHQTERNGFYVDSYTSQVHFTSPDKSSNDTVKSSSEESDSSSNRFDNPDSFSSIDRSDTPIQVPRWYSEVTKQISIPLEIEVLHHREEYAHHVSNGTEQVYHSVRSHEIEDHSSVPTRSTVIPIPIEMHSKETRLLPQVSGFPDVDDFSQNTSNEALRRQGGKTDRRIVPVEFKESNYPNYRDRNNISLHETVSHTEPTSSPALLTSDTEAKDSVRSVSIDSAPVSGVRQKFDSQDSDPTPSYKGTAEENRWIPKRQQQHIDEGTFAVHDVKIDEGLPSYRKRFPAVSQLFTPEETVADVGRLPDRRFRLSQQSPHTSRRRPSTARNRTRGSPQLGHESISPWKKHNLGSSSFINRQQTRFSDQGITFHHRGYGKAGVPGDPYDHHRKRLGVLPPGVSVHPRHPQAPYADLATDTADKTIPVNPLLHSRPRRIHLRHHRRHQRKRNRVVPSTEFGISATNCCSGGAAAGDGHNCCSSRRRGRHFSKAGCCSQQREGRRPNLVLPPETDKDKLSSRNKVEDVAQDRCVKEKMCRTVYQSAKKVLVCRNIAVEGC